MPGGSEKGKVPLVGAPPPGGMLRFAERREVTALFFDLIESTALLTHSDLEEYEEVTSGFQRRCRDAVRSEGGRVAETFGDGAIAFFGHPVPAEDSAAAAIQAGLEIIRSCRQVAAETGWQQLHVRVGIATSEVVLQDFEASGRPAVTGVAPVLASRLQTIAPPDAVVVSERVRRLAQGSFAFRFLGSRTLKGFDEPQKAWAVKRRIAGANRLFASGRHSTRMVGREIELGQALELWRQVCAGQGRTLIVSGEAGIGKSRLVYEAIRNTSMRRARVLALQCSPRRSDTALSPLIELLRAALDVSEERSDLSVERIAALMRHEGIHDDLVTTTIAFAVNGSSPPGRAGANEDPAHLRERLELALQRCIDIWLETRPVIVLVEDLQWIDPTSEGLLSTLIHWGRAKRIFLSSRPAKELRASGSEDMSRKWCSIPCRNRKRRS